MEISHLISLLLGMIVICAIYLIVKAVRDGRRAKLVNFCTYGQDANCDSVINKIDYKGLEVHRFTLCSYFRKIIDKGKIEQTDALYWSWQSVSNSKKKDLCRQTFKQAIIATKNPVLATIVATGLTSQMSGLQLGVVDAILSILAETPIGRRDEFFIKMLGKFEEFLLAEPDRTGFVAVMKFKIRKDLCL